MTGEKGFLFFKPEKVIQSFFSAQHLSLPIFLSAISRSSDAQKYHQSQEDLTPSQMPEADSILGHY